jgi:hypothetical protein
MECDDSKLVLTTHERERRNPVSGLCISPEKKITKPVSFETTQPIDSGSKLVHAVDGTCGPAMLSLLKKIE